MHVIEPPGIGFLQADRMRRHIGGGVIPAHLGDVARVVPGRARPARILPLGLGRQGENVSSRQVPGGLLPIGQLLVKLHHLLIGDALHRPVVALEVGRVVPRHRRPLRLGHIGRAHEKRMRNRHHMRPPAAHGELPRGNQDELELVVGVGLGGKGGEGGGEGRVGRRGVNGGGGGGRRVLAPGLAGGEGEPANKRERSPG